MGSVPLERRGEASQFWTATASVGSPSPSDSAREILLAKRISLTHHAPDIVQLAVQQQHEFIKVKNELKHVEDTQTAVSRRFPQLSVGSRQTTEMSSSSSSSHEEDQVAMRRSNSKDLILDLVPAPVETMEVKSTESKSVSQVESIVESQVESIVESQVVSQVESIVESQVDSLIGSTVDSKIESKKESKVKDKVESKVEARVEEKVEKKKAVKKERSQTTM